MAYVPSTANMFVATSPFTDSKGVAFSNDGLNWADFYDATFIQDASSLNMQILGVAFADSTNGWDGIITTLVDIIASYATKKTMLQDSL